MCEIDKDTKTRFIEIRREKNLTQEQLGEILGVTRNVIANIENGRMEASKLYVNHFCSKFNINKDWLLYGVGNKDRDYLSESEEKLLLQILPDIFSDIALGNKSKMRNIIELLPELDYEYLEIIEKLIKGIIKK
ncbi:TPA: helix-turn-helix domain-containing protein [Clostridioides difficile]|nr:helix-turn-helix transcriptional regulator [Clostridioides difficile]MCH4299884.1 helix-turn-helix transcriptional regulator [Clostridioides difficile]MCI4304703.1 helix-turn-helix transcriptional regulator [Clostridioides difficile]MCM4101600.1 helix-turn-helix transcriptional regulator [Clostridioides difficile]MDE3445548.1 helix-turn-helix transcriptional regulator [Clostridioides difficile]